jgi:hypothetical protein
MRAAGQANETLLALLPTSANDRSYPVHVLQVLSSMRHIEADIAALSAAQAACLAAARPFAKNGATSSSSSSSNSVSAAAAAGDSKYAGLRHELDRAYLAACKVTEWREMIQVRWLQFVHACNKSVAVGNLQHQIAVEFCCV